MTNFMIVLSAFFAITLVQSLPNGPSNDVDSLSLEPVFDGEVGPFVTEQKDYLLEVDEYSNQKVPVSLDSRKASKPQIANIRMVSEGESKFSHHLPEDFDMSKVDNETDIEKLLNEYEEEVKEFKAGLKYITENSTATTARHHDCQVHYSLGARINGLYMIHPVGVEAPFEVYCDFYTGAGGWTMITKRSNGYQFFYRDWDDYVKGFGWKADDHWLGLDNIHYLSTQKRYKLRVDLYDCDGSHRFAVYNYFALGDPGTKYELVLGTYSGDAGNAPLGYGPGSVVVDHCGTEMIESDPMIWGMQTIKNVLRSAVVKGDSLSFHRYQRFSTFDNDNDASSSNCAQTYKGGWWYKNCYEANLNGIFYNCNQGPPGSAGIAWKTFRGTGYSLNRVEMKILPL